MPQLHIALSGSTIVNGAHKYEISDAHVAELINYLIDKHSPHEGRDRLTAMQAFDAWVLGFIGETVAEVGQRKREQAIAAIQPESIKFE